MTQGESSQEKIYDTIFLFLIKNNNPATAKEIRAHCDCAKATFYKYLNELYAERRLDCIPKRGTGNDEYKITTKWSNKMRKKLNQQPRNSPFSWREFKEVLKKNEELERKVAELEEQAGEAGLSEDDLADIQRLLRGLREGKLRIEPAE
jgi:hypothetical protein